MTKVIELTTDIKNPQVDRRSKDWNKLPVLTKGQRFTLHDGYGEVATYIHASDHRFNSEYTRGGLGKLILDNSVEVEPKSLTEFARIYDCDYGESDTSIAGILLKLGRIGPDDFKAVAKYFDEHDS